MNFDPEKITYYPSALTVPTRALGGYTPLCYATAKIDGVRKEDYDNLLELYRKAISTSIQEGAWVCNECGSREFTGSVSADDFQDDGMSCTRCGGTEFHWKEK